MSDAVAISHPEKVLFPDDGITKGDLCAYYESIAPLMLPHITGRPVTMERFPAGIGKKGFIHKDVSKGFPAWLERVAVEKRDEKDPGTVHYALANDTRSRGLDGEPELGHAARLVLARAEPPAAGPVRVRSRSAG